jgi:hypothetical protein
MSHMPRILHWMPAKRRWSYGATEEYMTWTLIAPDLAKNEKADVVPSSCWWESCAAFRPKWEGWFHPCLDSACLLQPTQVV